MKLYCTNDADDLKFLCYSIDNEVELIKSDTLRLESTCGVAEDLDGIIGHIYKLHGEEPSEKAIAEFKKARASPRTIKGAPTVLTMANYINVVKKMLESGSLKDKDYIDEFTKALSLKFDPDFFLLEMKAGKILQIDLVEGMDKIFCEKVLSDHEYTICSGLREHYTKEELEGSTDMFIFNMKKAKFRGIESEGMICCTKSDERIEVLKVDADPGVRLQLEGQVPLFEGIRFGKIDISKARYKAALAGFAIIDHHLTFKGTKVTCAGKYITTSIKNGPVS